MYHITVGSVSGIIAAVIAILQFVVPNALVIALVGTLSECHSAVTWSVVSRSLQSSHWPLILRPESASTTSVQPRIKAAVWLRPVTLALIAVAAVVTPVGLYEVVQPGRKPQLVTFVYQPDDGPFGTSHTRPTCTYTADIVHNDYDRRIPAVLAELYQSGLKTQPRSVSSFFDIGWKSYNTRTGDNIGNQTYLVDSYRAISSLLLSDDVHLVQGLIVDGHSGRVGFRDHTVPSSTEVPYGAEFAEDILFLEPETACVDINITVKFQMPLEGQLPGLDGPIEYLVDNGGFVNLSHHDPWLDLFENGTLYGDTQCDPRLEDRAYRSAWTMNVENMFFFNLTAPHSNSSAYLDFELGKTFAMNNTISNTMLQVLSLLTVGANPFESLVSVPQAQFDWDNATYDVTNTSTNSIFGVSSAPNPFGLTDQNYTFINDVCMGSMSDDFANSTNIQVKCGLVLGVASKAGNQTPNACRARVMVDSAYILLYNKQYQNVSEMPMWGIETPNMTLRDVDPLWGIVDPSMRDSVNLTVIQAEQIYIPASSVAIRELTLSASYGVEYIPAVQAPAMIWETAYALDLTPSVDGVQDLSGLTSLALATKWKQMSANANGTAAIMNLRWTDLAANALVGTRGWLTDDSLPPNLQGVQRRDTVPGVGDGRVPVIRFFLWRLSAGRLLAALRLREEDFVSPTKEWAREQGSAQLLLAEAAYEPIAQEEQAVASR
ncbi:hypothetical protein LTR85_007090 [Meristemomyces frigidus]|nr:hypothetical protein LTR85_007090 [Meristemomyces frigidus]